MNDLMKYEHYLACRMFAAWCEYLYVTFQWIDGTINCEYCYDVSILYTKCVHTIKYNYMQLQMFEYFNKTSVEIKYN